jgi:hypothetical protein
MSLAPCPVSRVAIAFGNARGRCLVSPLCHQKGNQDKAHTMLFAAVQNSPNKIIGSIL